MELKTAKVVFQPSGKRGSVPVGISLVDASRRLGVDIEAPCGENQVCGKCKIRVEAGVFHKLGIESARWHAGPWQPEEEKFITEDERHEGYRLGCAATVNGDLLVYVPESSRAGKQVVSKAARPLDILVNPAVKQYAIELIPPSLDDPAGDFERVREALKKQHGLASVVADLNVLHNLHQCLTAGGWKVCVSVWMEREIIHVSPGRSGGCYGLAVDVGTTTVAVYLCNLKTGEVTDTLSMMNPQVRYGEDVVSRISYHLENDDGLRRMSEDLVDGLNSLIDRALTREYDISSGDDATGMDETRPGRIERDEILDICIVGNTAMHHILLQLDPESLGGIPFAPVLQTGLDIKARQIGIRINPAAHLYMLPCEAGYVGGDNVGVILAEEPHRKEEIELLIDIGTNGELVLGNKERLICSSCATGPALEGAQIEFGMRAAPGAIERVRIDPDTHESDYKVIGRDAWRCFSSPGEMRAKGICGSGILDAVSQLFLAGIIEKSGAFTREPLRSDRLTTVPGSRMKAFVIAWENETSIGKDILITQKDVRQIQLAKAAVYTGCKLMMRKLNIETINKIRIAGAFGTHIDTFLALAIGLFPDCPIDHIVSVGNAAGDGCRIALLNRDKRVEADWVARKVTYMELTLEKDFQEQLLDAIAFPHMKDAFPHLAGILPGRDAVKN